MVNSKIEWTSHTFNPWMGCTKVSEGCKNCYAEASESKRLHKVEWGKGKPRRKTSKEAWKEPLKWEKAAKKSGENPLVFCASLADVFDEDVDDSWREDLFALIGSCPSLRWLLLTKRPKTMLRYKKQIEALPQIWVGTTAENQKRFDERVPDLIKIKSPVRFVSMEPLIGPVVLGKLIKDLEWVIVGGESSTDGKSARLMNFSWAANIRDECTTAKVPFFFKQWGGRSNPEKKAKGKKLDGRRWTEYPRGFTITLPDKLTQPEQDRLEEWEQQVTEGVKASITAAKALHKIYAYKEGKLWKAQGFEKFQDYCLATWKYAKSHSYRLAEAGGFVLELEKYSPNGENIPLPQNESQIRPVLELPEGKRVEFWKEKIIDLGPDQITTKTVSNAVEEFRAENKIPPEKKKVGVAKVKTPAELKTRAVVALARLESAVEGLPNSKKIQVKLKHINKLLA